MDYKARQRRFREYATAMIRRDGAEAARIHRLFGPDLAVSYHLFVFSLFSAAVIGHFGPELDRAELAEAMTGLREERPDLHWLRAEALIRVCYGESRLFQDIPQVEQPEVMWAVLLRLIPPDTDDPALTELFTETDQIGRDVVVSTFRSERLFGWADEPEETPTGAGEEP